MWIINDEYTSFTANTEVEPTLPLKCTLVYYDNHSSKKGNKTLNSDISKDPIKILGQFIKDTLETEIQAEIRFISINNPNPSEEHIVEIKQNSNSTGKETVLRNVIKVKLKQFWSCEYVQPDEWKIYDENGVYISNEITTISGIISVNGDTNQNAWVKFSVADLLASEDITIYDIVNSDGFKSDSSQVNKQGKVLGIAIENIGNATTGRILTSGEVKNVAWNFTPGSRIYLNGNALSETPPSSGFTQCIGIAKELDTLVVKLGEAIKF